MGWPRLFWRLTCASVRSQAQYPGSAIMLAIAHFLTTVVEIGAVWALFDRFGDLQGWSFGEVAVFYGLANIMFALADLISRGFDVLGSDLLRTGAFDRLLLRPRGLTLQLMAHDVRLSRLGRLLQGLLALAIATRSGHVAWSIGHVGLALWSVAGGVALFLGLMVLQGTLSFWTVESLEVANVMTYGGVQAVQYPLSLYGGWLRGTLTFIVPLACVAYYPVLGILERPDPLGAPAWLGQVSPVAGFAFLALSLVAWGFGVRHYTSTGS